MSITSWLFGAYHNFAAATFDVEDAVPTSESKTIAAGDYYPYDTTTSLSLLGQLVAAVNSHSGISDCAGGVTKSGALRIYRTGGSNFAIKNMPVALSSTLGFTTSLTGASAYTAGTVSPRFWSPGRRASSQVAPLGVVGQAKRDTMIAQAATGSIEVVTKNSDRVNEFFWRFLPIARVWTQSENNGEWYTFHDTVIAAGATWKLWQSVDEDTTDGTTLVTLGSSLGPYVTASGVEEWAYLRELPNVDKLSRVTLRAVQVAEI